MDLPIVDGIEFVRGCMSVLTEAEGDIVRRRTWERISMTGISSIRPSLPRA